jgi:hypothetical protein
MTKRTRILISLGALALLCVAYLCVFGYQTYSIVMMHRYATRFPVLNNVPVALSDLSVSTAPGTRLSYFGYDFEVPWTDIDNDKSKLMKNRVVIAFHSGNAMMLSNVPKDDFVNGVAATFHLTPEKLRDDFSDQIRNDYSFKTLILNMTPSRITLTTPWRQCNSMGILLMLKAVMLPSADADLYSIRTPNFVGYQFGDPNRHPAKIGVELYSSDGMLEFYLFQKVSDVESSISQADLNRIVETVHKSPEN